MCCVFYAKTRVSCDWRSFVTFLLVSGITYIVETVLVSSIISCSLGHNYSSISELLYCTSILQSQPQHTQVMTYLWDIIMRAVMHCDTWIRSIHIYFLLSLRCIRLKKRVLQICHSARPINMYELIFLDWKETCRRFSFGRNREEVKRTRWKV
jgi:hypothetical protein